MTSKFPIGQLVTTSGVTSFMQEKPRYARFVEEDFQRYINCDWGDLSEGDKRQNDKALIQKDNRIFASYDYPHRPEWRLWIITEQDYSATTLLFPKEYLRRHLP